MMFALTLCLAFAGVDNTPARTPEQLDALVKARQNVEAIRLLRKNNCEVDPSGSIEKSQLNGMTYEELVLATGGDYHPPTAWQRVSGWFTFVNILLFTSVVLVLSALVWLFRIYLITLVFLIPVRAWNALAWGLCLLCLILAKTLAPDHQLLLILPGALGILPTWTWTAMLYFPPDKNYWSFFLTLTILWSVVTLVFSSSVIGFLSVMALMATFGFVAGMFPGVVFAGFENDDAVYRGTVAAGIVLLLHVLMTITGVALLAPFRTGMMWMGSFVFYLGLLILSSKWMCYSNDGSYRGCNWNVYWIRQILTIVCGVLALFLGTVFAMPVLLGVGGTFFYIYILEKYYELPWEGAGWAWSLLGLGLLLYCFSAFARTHPSYFLFMS
jgi:hypothetical protein